MVLELSASCSRAPGFSDCGSRVCVAQPAVRCRIVHRGAGRPVRATATSSKSSSAKQHREVASARCKRQDSKASATVKSIDTLLGLDQMDTKSQPVEMDSRPAARSAALPSPRRDQAAAAERRDELARQALTLMAAVGAASLVFSAYWDFGAYQMDDISAPKGSSCVARDGRVDCGWSRGGLSAWEEGRIQP